MISFKVENVHKHVNALFIINIFKSTPLIKLTFLFLSCSILSWPQIKITD